MSNLCKLQLSSIDKVGEKKIELLNDMGINNIEDLIYFYPNKYEIIKRSDPNNLIDNGKVIIDGVIEGQATLLTISKTINKIILRINTRLNIFNVCIYNHPVLLSKLKVGSEITVYGIYDKMQNCIISDQIKFGVLPVAPIIEPIYPSKEGLSSKLINKYIVGALNSGLSVDDALPIDIQKKYNFEDKITTLKQIHSPDDIASLKRARQRIKYEEIFKYLLCSNKYLNYNQKKVSRTNSVKKYLEDISLSSNLKEGLESILMDMKSNLVKKLVQTDNYFDKFDIIIYTAYYNYISGYQTLIYLEDETLIKLLNNKITKCLSKDVYENDMIVITSNSSNIKFNKLGLVICDLNNRFKMYENKELQYKNHLVDYLFISNRTYSNELLSSLYKDVSHIDITCGSNNTFKTEITKDYNIDDYISNSLSNNKQVIIYMKKNKVNFIKSILNNYDSYKILNKESDKKEVYKLFNKKEFKILVTIFDDYINISQNKTDLIILDGELFLTTHLNMIRNKVLYNNSGNCMIACKDITNGLKYLKQNSNSLEMAVIDMKYRTKYNFIDKINIFKMVNINKDYNMIEKVNNEVINYINRHIYIDIY